MTSRSTYAIIPARGGSKGVPRKNVKLLQGFPLIAYSIVAARLSKMTDRVIVSTESSEIAEIAVQFGAEVPFLRPAEYAGDRSPDIDFIVHAIDWFAEHDTVQPDLFAHLRPTTPLRDPVLIDKAIDEIRQNTEATALRSVHELAEPPQKMFMIENGYLAGFFPDEKRPEYYNLPRQVFPKAYHPNGYVDIIRTGFVKETKTLHGPKMIGFVTPFTIEIDTPDEFIQIEYALGRGSHPLLEYLTQNY